VTGEEQEGRAPVVQQVGRAVREQRVALHLAKADAAAELAPLDRLPRQRVHRPDRAHLGISSAAQPTPLS
jgi:hypothetical protein